ncbi:hypothetical protein ACHAXT_009393 [Thalassiosira profunda]
MTTDEKKKGAAGGGAGKSLEETAKEWDASAAGWDKGFMGSMVGRFNARALEVVEGAAQTKFSGGSCDVLDFGCGTGQMTLPLAALATSVHATDVAPKMIAALDAKLAAPGAPDNVTTWCGDIASAGAPQADASFDLVYSGSVITFVPDLPAVLAKLASLMRPGALAVHFVWEDKRKDQAPREPGRTDGLHYQDGISEAQLLAELEASVLMVKDVGYIPVPIFGCLPCCCTMRWLYVIAEKPLACT